MFAWPVRVYYEDTDAGGVVYYANYLRFFERARTEWLRSLGVDHQALAREAGLQFVVRRAEIDFLRGARLDDPLEITVELAQRKRTYRPFRGEAHYIHALNKKVHWVRRAWASLGPGVGCTRLRVGAG